MLQHADIHKECLCYQKGSKQTISIQKVKRGDTGSSLLTSHHIIFVIRGTAKYTIKGLPDVSNIIRLEEFVFMPVSTYMLWEALDDTVVLLFRVSHLVGNLPECRTFRFQRLSGNLDAGHIQIKNRGVYPLKMNKRIRYFIKDILATELDGLKCDNYAKHLCAILLIRIQVYYPQKEYMRFYSTVTSSDVVFFDVVHEKWMGCRSVGELANLFDMNTKRFALQFSRVFGENPGLWLKKRRMEYIYRDICSSHKSLGQIAKDHGFLLTNFVRYCRMNFNNTPDSIRKNLSANRHEFAAALVDE